MIQTTPDLVVFINGKSSSGKSYFCQLLETVGYQVISSSESFEEFCKNINLPSSNRSELNQSGVSISQSVKHMNEFAMLLHKKANRPLVAYDGIRLAETLNVLKNLFPHTFSIYLNTKVKIRQKRHTERELNFDFNLQETNETIMGDKKIRTSADIILSDSSVLPFTNFVSSIKNG